MHRGRSELLLLAFLFVGGCRSRKIDAVDGGDSSSWDAFADAGGDTGDDTVADGMTSDGPDGDSSAVDADAGDACPSCDEALVTSLAQKTRIDGTCTAVIRMDDVSLKILGHAVMCGPYAMTTEESARTAARSVVFTYAHPPVADGMLILGPAPVDEWMFLQNTTAYGGIVAVSTRSGLVVFAGDLNEDSGLAKIREPSLWDTTDVGFGFPRPTPVPVRAFDLLENREVPPKTEVVNVALATAYPSAFARWGALFDVVVLHYYRTALGLCDPAPCHHDFIVLLNAGVPRNGGQDAAASTD
jgi:hypothetical protein